MTIKARPNISIDKDVWDWWMEQKTVNKSAMINQMLKEQMEIELAEERQ